MSLTAPAHILSNYLEQQASCAEAYSACVCLLTLIRRTPRRLTETEHASVAKVIRQLINQNYSEPANDLWRQFESLTDFSRREVLRFEAEIIGMTSHLSLPLDDKLPVLDENTFGKMKELFEKCTGVYELARNHEERQEDESPLTRLDNEFYLFIQAKPEDALWDKLYRLKQQSSPSDELTQTVSVLFNYGKALLQATKLTQALAWYQRLYGLCEGQASGFAEQALAGVLTAIGHPVAELQLPPARWQTYREQIKTLRDTFTAQCFDKKASAAFNQAISTWLKARWEEAVAQTGLPPDVTCLIALGSLSREAMCLYSDVECALLLKETSLGNWEKTDFNPQRRLVQQTWWLFEWMVMSLGEPKGLHLDANSQPRMEPDLRHTPKMMAKRCIGQEQTKDDGLIYSLLHPCYLAGNPVLFNDYNRALTKVMTTPCKRQDVPMQHPLPWRGSELTLFWHRYWALSQLKRNQAVYQELQLPELGAEIDIKKPYYKLLTFLILDTALYHHLPATNPWQALEALKAQRLLPVSFCDKVIDYLNQLQSLRNLSQDKAQSQQDMVIVDKALLMNLTRLYETILTPFYGQLKTLFDLGWPSFYQELWLTSLCQLDLSSTPLPQTATLEVITLSPEAQVYQLPDAFAKTLFSPQGDLNRPSGQLNSIVMTHKQYVLKLPVSVGETVIEAQDSLQQFIATEEAVSHLSRLLGDAVVPAGCAVKISYQGKTYYAWLCEHISGNTLAQVERAPQQLKQIDIDSYAALFLLSLLTYPEDGQPRNFKLVPQGTQFQLISIDNKRAFVNPWRVIRGFFYNSQAINSKTKLYLLPQTDQALPFFYHERFLTLDSQILTAQWQQLLANMDKAYYHAIHRQPLINVPMQKYATLNIPKLMVYWLPVRLQQIKRLLVTRKTFKQILKELEPELATHYEGLQQKNKPFIEHFNEYRIDNQGRIFSTSTQSFIKTQQAQAQVLRSQLLTLMPEYFANLDFTGRSYEEQSYMLELMEDQVFTGALSFKGCVMLTDDRLQKILRKSPELAKLDISDCPLITEKTFANVSWYCYELESLAVDGNFSLRRLEWNAFSLSKLTTVSLRRCSNLQYIRIMFTHALKYLSVIDTPAPEIIHRSHYAQAFFERGMNNTIEEEKLLDLQNGVYLDSNLIAGRILLTQCLGNLGQYEAAIKEINIILNHSQSTPDNKFIAYKLLGDIRTMQKNNTEAIEAYIAALDIINPASVDMRDVLVDIYRKLSVNYDALEQFLEMVASTTELINLGADLIDDRVGLAVAFKSLVQYEAAIKEINVILNHPQATPVEKFATYGLLGDICKLQKKYTKAIEAYTEAIELKSQNLESNFSSSYNDRATIYFELGQYERALGDLTQAITLNPEKANYYNDRGYIYTTLGQPQEAIADYKQAINLDPKNADYYNNFGWNYLDIALCSSELNNREFIKQANDNFVLSQQFEMDNPLFKIGLGFVALITNQFEVAHRHYQAILQWPKSHESLNRAKLYAEIGLNLLHYRLEKSWTSQPVSDAWQTLQEPHRKQFICQQLTLFLLAMPLQTSTHWHLVYDVTIDLIEQTKKIQSAPILTHYQQYLRKALEEHLLPEIAKLTITPQNHKSLTQKPKNRSLTLFNRKKVEKNTENLNNYSSINVTETAPLLSTSPAVDRKLNDTPAKLIISPTVGYGQCFFHAAYGKSKNGQYQVDNPQQLREEWCRYLGQFDSLADNLMPETLRAQLAKILNMFFEQPLLPNSAFANNTAMIRRDVNRKLDTAKQMIARYMAELKEKLINQPETMPELFRLFIFNLLQRKNDATVLQVQQVLGLTQIPSEARTLNLAQLIQHKESLISLYREPSYLLQCVLENIQEYVTLYDVSRYPSYAVYAESLNAETIMQIYLNHPTVYQAYLGAIESPDYFIFLEELPILAALSQTTLHIWYQEQQGNTVKHTISPNGAMIVWTDGNSKTEGLAWDNTPAMEIYHDGFNQAGETAGLHFSRANSQMPNIPIQQVISNNFFNNPSPPIRTVPRQQNEHYTVNNFVREIITLQSNELEDIEYNLIEQIKRDSLSTEELFRQFQEEEQKRYKNSYSKLN